MVCIDNLVELVVPFATAKLGDIVCIKKALMKLNRRDFLGWAGGGVGLGESGTGGADRWKSRGERAR